MFTTIASAIQALPRRDNAADGGHTLVLVKEMLPSCGLYGVSD